jgi:hypothetical protein
MLSKETMPGRAGAAEPFDKGPANDNAIGSLSSPAPDREDAERRFRLAAFPPGTRVLIRRRERAVNQIGRARQDEWLLRFDPQSRLFVDPLTGWTGGSDPLRHVELGFATLEQAIRYAERHALPYRIDGAMLRRPTQSKTKEALHEQAA